MIITITNNETKQTKSIEFSVKEMEYLQLCDKDIVNTEESVIDKILLFIYSF